MGSGRIFVKGPIRALKILRMIAEKEWEWCLRGILLKTLVEHGARRHIKREGRPLHRQARREEERRKQIKEDEDPDRFDLFSGEFAKGLWEWDLKNPMDDDQVKPFFDLSPYSSRSLHHACNFPKLIYDPTEG